MSYHQPLAVPGAFPGVRAGLRHSTPPIRARSALEVRIRIDPAPLAPAAEEFEMTDRAAGAEDMCARLRTQMLHEIEQALKTDDAGIAGFHVGLATLYARRLAAGQANSD